MNNPKVSVVITTCNRANLLPRAIRSVLSQDYPNYDIHIVDDGSIDCTTEIVRPFVEENRNVFFWQQTPQQGLSSARNCGIYHSNGEYVAFLDDDDEYLPGSLSDRIRIVLKLTHKELQSLGVIHGGWEDHFDYSGRIVYRRPMQMKSIKDYAMREWFRPMSATSMYPRNVLENIGGFDEVITSSVEHDIWMKLAVNNYCAFSVKGPLAKMHIVHNKQSMCTDIRPRIIGIEGYLKKWRPTYENWYGVRNARNFIHKYRVRVYANLSAQKLFSGNIRDACWLFIQLIRNNGLGASAHMWLPQIYINVLAHRLLPTRLIIAMSRFRKSLHP